MASDIGPVFAPVTGLTQGSAAQVISKVQDAGGNTLPQSRQAAATQAAAQRAAVPANPPPPDLVALVALLNKYLNDSGKPYQYRVAPGSGNKLIQEINPANGRVLGEFPATEFPVLAASAGITGLLFNGHA